MPLQKLIGNIYSVIIEILLWIIPIAAAVGGYYYARYVMYISDAFLWVILGVVAGLIIDLILFGPVIIMLNIRASLKNIETK
ncbi:MAG: hypothetical protein LBT39_07315 [Treponema sp.]|jgi:hypothetical protein|nr:hypothetical protein [Treponema sp.]